MTTRTFITLPLLSLISCTLPHAPPLRRATSRRHRRATPQLRGRVMSDRDLQSRLDKAGYSIEKLDGRIGSGRSFLADLETKAIVSVRDFSVRTG